MILSDLNDNEAVDKKKEIFELMKNARLKNTIIINISKIIISYCF